MNTLRLIRHSVTDTMLHKKNEKTGMRHDMI